MLVSVCCGKLPLTEIYDNMGRCSQCRDNTEFYEEEKENKNDGNDEAKDG